MQKSLSQKKLITQCALKLNHSKYRLTKPSSMALVCKGLEVLNVLREMWINDNTLGDDKFTSLLADVHALSVWEYYSLYRVFARPLRSDNWMDKDE
jgi:hypothetical protein